MKVRDSNPRDLAVYCFSKAARLASLPTFNVHFYRVGTVWKEGLTTPKTTTLYLVIDYSISANLLLGVLAPAYAVFP